VSAATLLAVTLAIAAGSGLQGAVGFGGNLLAAPFLVLVDPDFVPGPALVAALALNVLMAWRESGDSDLREVTWALAGRVPGTLAGVLALVLLPSAQIELFFGLLLLVAVGLSALQWSLRPTPGTLLGAGAASGFMATTVAVGGPPIALVYQRATGPVIRSTLAKYFVVGISFSILALTVGGEFDADDLGLGLVLVPGTVVGFALSGRLADRLDQGWTRPAVLLLSALSAVVVLLDWALSG
jgi:uncharacterized protein